MTEKLKPPFFFRYRMEKGSSADRQKLVLETKKGINSEEWEFALSFEPFAQTHVDMRDDVVDAAQYYLSTQGVNLTRHEILASTQKA